jgi:hypothetical protein
VNPVWDAPSFPVFIRFLTFPSSYPFVDNPCWQMGYCGDLFSDLPFSHISNKAQNSNQDSIQAYSLFGRFLVTGLIGALLTPYFQISCIRAWNPKSPVLRGGKPALLFPFGWQITVQMGWSRGKTGKKACFEGEFQGSRTKTMPRVYE